MPHANVRIAVTHSGDLSDSSGGDFSGFVPPAETPSAARLVRERELAAARVPAADSPSAAQLIKKRASAPSGCPG